ncbi:MAG: regulatory protein RecX [Candidatus Omnitrophica bacterium]|nr:regulatory protein RecX [Candidatus Omnitrophota bacterium]
MKKDKTERAAAYAYRLFSIRPRSEKELKDRLYKKGFDHKTAQRVISLLKEKKIINDVKFAKLWIESRMRRNPKGDILLRRELRDKGISGSLIDKALSEKGENESHTARSIAEKKIESLKSLPKQKARKKLFDFLARRGFRFDIIEEIVREI